MSLDGQMRPFSTPGGSTSGPRGLPSFGAGSVVFLQAAGAAACDVRVVGPSCERAGCDTSEGSIDVLLDLRNDRHSRAAKFRVARPHRARAREAVLFRDEPGDDVETRLRPVLPR